MTTWLTRDHDRPSDDEKLKQLRSGEWEWSKFDMADKAVMWFLFVEQDMTTQEVYQHFVDNCPEDDNFARRDIDMSLKWWGLWQNTGRPMQARFRDIGKVLSFGHELYERNKR